MIMRNFVNNMKTPMISSLFLTCFAFFAIAAQATRTLSESWENKITMIIEYGKGRTLSPPPPPKPASPTQQITSGFRCVLENNQCNHLTYIKSDHKRKYSPPPPPPKSSPSPHEVIRPAPPPPKLPSSPPCAADRRPCLTTSNDYGRTARPPPPAPKPTPPRHHEVDNQKLINEASSKDLYLASS